MQNDQNSVQQYGIFRRIWHLVVGDSLGPENDDNREHMLNSSLILHLRPAQVSARAIRFTHTFGLGGMALVLIMLMFATGLLMMFAYEPSPERAYLSIVALQQDVLFGRLVRSVHHWSASLLIVVALLHFLRVFLTGSCGAPPSSRTRLRGPDRE